MPEQLPEMFHFVMKYRKQSSACNISSFDEILTNKEPLE